MAVLCSLTNVQAQLGISSDSSLLSAYALRVDIIVANMCNRKDGFLSSSHTETFDGMNSDRFVLTYTPVVASSAVITITGFGSDTETVDDDLYTVESATGIVGFRDSFVGRYNWGYDFPPSTTLSRKPDLNFGRGFRNVSVVYTGGYATASVPLDLQQIAIDMTCFLYRERNRDRGIQSESLGNYSYTLGNVYGDGGFMDQIKQRLRDGGYIAKEFIS